MKTTKSSIGLVGITTVLLAALTGCSSDGLLVSKNRLDPVFNTTWSSARVVDDRTIEIESQGGSCDHYAIETTENETSVTINLFVGSTGERQCTLESITHKLLVKTESPVGDREIIDGHAQ